MTKWFKAFLLLSITMGIPSYFAHFVKQHRQIIKPVNRLNKPINNLYLDCNGFIYEGTLKFVSEEALIKSVCDKLIYYISLLKPNKKVFIAFDGVAPVAKLDQQRKRRYLSWFQGELLANFSKKNEITTNDVTKQKWNTSAITPGTLFMDALALGIKQRFQNPREFGLEQFIISCADEVGEGEHKIYEYIRKEPFYHKFTTTVIYGLDADLIMLTLNHLHISNQMHLFRETPEFIKSVDNTLNPNELYLLDIPEFGKKIVEEFTPASIGVASIGVASIGVASISVASIGVASIGVATSSNPISDYIFLFFLLGNDFLPHFPALNIRTNGIDLLLNAYREAVLTKHLSLIEDGKIVWKNLRLLIDYLSQNELTYIKQEYAQKTKCSNKRTNHSKFNTTPLKSFEDKLTNLPSTDRASELYINPEGSGWEARYYHTLFDIRHGEERQKEICQNYLEGLEWTFKYYSTGCVDWHWTYKYHYPPLLADLIKYVPYYDTLLISKEKLTNKAVSPYVQLSYVLPKQNLYLLPSEFREKLLKEQPDWYADKCEFQWAFCKYFWEAHVKLPEIDINELQKRLLGKV